MKVWYSNPYSTEKNIGKALNEFCALIPDDDWIALQDGDLIYLTPEWGNQIADVVKNYGNKYSLIGCMTNRLGRPIQRYNGKFSDNHDMKHHYDIAVDLQSRYWGIVEDVTAKGRIAGLFMLFPKSIWNKIKFAENASNFDDLFSLEVLKAGGKLGLMKGLYVYHLYRIWSDKPSRDKGHLL